jgi:large subunit ribosomal protein L29
MKNAEFKSLTAEELKEKITVEQANLQRLKFAHAITPIENPIKIRSSRRVISRLLTELRAKEIANAK